MALANIMRLSSKKGAHPALSSAAWQEIRVRFGRDDKGEGCASGESGGWTEAIFVFVNGPKATGTPDGDDKVVELLRAAHRLEKPQFSPEQPCHLDRSAAEWRDLRFLFGSKGLGSAAC